MSVADFATPTVEPSGFHALLKEWTVDEYHQLIKCGIIHDGAPIELLDGMLVYKDRGEGDRPTTYGPRHASLISALMALNDVLKPYGYYMRLQQPITIRPRHEPEPDGAIVCGVPLDYRDHNPGPTECYLVIEGADSSLQGDRNRKQRIYSEAGIAVYWIVNLRHNTVEVYEQPDAERGEYRVRRDSQIGDTLEIRLPEGPVIPIRVADLLA
jgi:Uma2 family endonuclease